MSDLYMVFDVESIGLHGEGFAVGYVVVTRDGEVVGDRIFACSPDQADGSDEGRAWVRDNCPPLVWNCSSPREVRRFFWNGWLSWKDQGAVLVADCAWPVEARFLAACVDDDPEHRQWQGPYPLHELASFMVGAGMDPMATYDRLPDEPQHDPLGDARQSARLLLTALNRIAASQERDAALARAEAAEAALAERDTALARAEAAERQVRERVRLLHLALQRVEVAETRSDAWVHHCALCGVDTTWGASRQHTPNCPFAALAADQQGVK